MACVIPWNIYFRCEWKDAWPKETLNYFSDICLKVFLSHFAHQGPLYSLQCSNPQSSMSPVLWLCFTLCVAVIFPYGSNIATRGQKLHHILLATLLVPVAKKKFQLSLICPIGARGFVLCLSLRWDMPIR